jgi:hypothetical protein
MDVATLKRWVESVGFTARSTDDKTLALELPEPDDDDAPPSVSAEVTPARRGAGESLPPLFVQLSQNWVLFSMLDVLGDVEFLPDDLAISILQLGRDLPVVKYAFAEDESVIVCAELPTESLDRSEVQDVAVRMIDAYRLLRRVL